MDHVYRRGKRATAGSGRTTATAAAGIARHGKRRKCGSSAASVNAGASTRKHAPLKALLVFCFMEACFGVGGEGEGGRGAYNVFLYPW